MNDEKDLTLSMVIFGASGDLAHRKLIPALFSLFRKDRLPEKYHIIGYAANDWKDEDFRKSLREGLTQFADYAFTEAEWKKFAKHLFYIHGDFVQTADYEKLRQRLDTLESGPSGRIYYLATPPAFFGPITKELGQAGMIKEDNGWRRVVIEKPFGSNLQTARELNKTLHQVLDENQIFRIDHYLGKETVQNILVFRFANTIFEPIWNRKYIDNVQISVLETVGVGHRAGYYDKAGVLRDMFQNHILQLLMLIAIEPPSTLKQRDLHDRKIEVLKALQPLTGADVAKNTVQGQYKGYLKEPGVAPHSRTPTYAALRVFIDHPRWEGVPFFLRSGKSMTKKCTEIIIQFKCPPTIVEPMPPTETVTPNILAMCIQPDEGIFLRFEAKVPDTEADMRSVEMEFHYSESFGTSSIPEAYERLLLEIMQGDHTLFTRDETTELAWKFIDPIIAAWDSPNAQPLEIYDQGSYGPSSADKLMSRDDWHWLVTCGQHDDDPNT